MKMKLTFTLILEMIFFFFEIWFLRNSEILKIEIFFFSDFETEMILFVEVLLVCVSVWVC